LHSFKHKDNLKDER